MRKIIINIIGFIVFSVLFTIELFNCLEKHSLSITLIIIGCIFALSLFLLIAEIKAMIRREKEPTVKGIVHDVQPETKAPIKKEESPVKIEPFEIFYKKSLEKLQYVADIRDSFITNENGLEIHYPYSFPGFFFKLKDGESVNEALNELIILTDACDNNGYKYNEVILVVDKKTGENCNIEYLKELSNNKKIRVVTNPEQNIFKEFAFNYREYVVSVITLSTSKRACVSPCWNVRYNFNDVKLISLMEGDTVRIHEYGHKSPGSLYETVDLNKTNGVYSCICCAQTDRMNAGGNTIDVPDDFIVDDKIDLGALKESLKRRGFITNL